VPQYFPSCYRRGGRTRLQIYKDQHAQALEAISDGLKKFSAADRSLVENMK
jgi:hypothetical protein